MHHSFINLNKFSKREGNITFKTIFFLVFENLNFNFNFFLTFKNLLCKFCFTKYLKIILQNVNKLFLFCKSFELCFQLTLQNIILKLHCQNFHNQFDKCIFERFLKSLFENAFTKYSKR